MAKIPAKIGKYKVLSLIAKGGMGAVYKGIHPTLNRHVILKKLTLRGNSSFAERFKREARIMMDFKNDFIVDVYDHFKEGSSYYIVLEYIDGMALDTLLKQQRYLPNDVALLIFFEACKALLYAHNKNVIHRDIKPANILMSKEGDVKLVDFGIATSKDDADDGLTREGMTLGTPSYMAPEQFQNTKNVDNRADIYSMGIMLYEMVTGKKPYPGTFSPESITMIQKGKYKKPQKINPRVSGIIRRLITKSMCVKPQKRYQNLETTIVTIKKYLKRSAIPGIRERLVKLIKGEKIPQEHKKKGSLLKRIIMISLLSIAVLGGVLLFGYMQNYHYELLFPSRYGALTVSVKLPVGLKSGPKDYYIRADLFKDDNKTIPGVKGIKFNFKPLPVKKGDKALILKSQRVYLPTDHYRLKFSVENRVIWQSFFISPRSIQKSVVNTTAGKHIEFNAVKPPVEPVLVMYEVTDHTTGKNITLSTDMLFLYNGKYYKWSDNLAKTLRSGNSYSFKFTKAGYYEKVYALGIKPYQNTLKIKTTLVPKPGTVTVLSNTKGIKLKLNGTGHYTSGGQQGLVAGLRPASSKSQEWLLGPGRYTLEAGPYRGAKVKTMNFSLQTGQKLALQVNYNKEKKVIEFVRK